MEPNVKPKGEDLNAKVVDPHRRKSAHKCEGA
jgi:hypothetical protein